MPLQPGEIALMENANPQLGSGEFHIIEVTDRAVYGIPAFPTNEVFVRVFRADQGWIIARHGIKPVLTQALLRRLHDYQPNQHTPEGYVEQLAYLRYRIVESVKENAQWEDFVEAGEQSKIGSVGDNVVGTHDCEQGQVKRVPIPPGAKYLDVHIEDDDEDGENFVFAYV